MWQIVQGVVYAKDKTELIWQWLIDIGVAPTRTNKTMTDRYKCDPKHLNWTNMIMIDQYRYNPDPNWIQTDRKMTDWYKCDPDSN